MLQVSAQTRCYICIEPQDFRRGIDGMGALVRQKLEQDPMSGGWYLFRNKRGSSLKILFYDGSGYWLCQKRLSSGKLKWWPKEQEEGASKGALQLAAREIQVLLWNGDPSQVQFAPEWKKLA